MTINCPKCKASLKLRETAVGKIVRCPKCQERFTAPSATAEASPLELADPVSEESPLEQMAAAAQSNTPGARPQYAAPAQQFQNQVPASPNPGGFTCPFCHRQGPPIITKKISTSGWILFIVLLLCCFPLCWLPFVMDGCKDEERKCAGCGTKLG